MRRRGCEAEASVEAEARCEAEASVEAEARCEAELRRGGEAELRPRARLRRDGGEPEASAVCMDLQRVLRRDGRLDLL